MENNQSYFERRAAQERSAASMSSDSKARQAHLELASRYDDLAASCDTARATPAA